MRNPPKRPDSERLCPQVDTASPVEGGWICVVQAVRIPALRKLREGLRTHGLADAREAKTPGCRALLLFLSFGGLRRELRGGLVRRRLCGLMCGRGGLGFFGSFRWCLHGGCCGRR